MKTLSEVVREHEEHEQRRIARNQTLLESLEQRPSAIPLFVSDDPTNVTNYDTLRTVARGLLRSRHCQLYDVACDTCRTQLVNPNDGPLTPKGTRALCPGCGWIGFVPRGAYYESNDEPVTPSVQAVLREVRALLLRFKSWPVEDLVARIDSLLGRP